MKIGILSRGKNIYSTRRLVEAGNEKGHEMVVMDHTKCSLIMEKGKPQVIFNGQPIKDIDVIIPRIGASVTFFGASVIRQFQAMSIPSTLSSVSLVRSRDKLRSFQLLSKVGLAIPKSVFARHPKDKDVEDLIESVGGAPVVLKRLEGTQGVGVVLADTVAAAKSMIEAFSGMQENIIIQEYIEEAGGSDIRVLVVDGEVVGAMKRSGKPGEFRSNLHRGGKAEAIEITKKEKALALEAVKSLSLSVAGVDLIRAKRGPLIMEVNSSPGLEGIEKATGIDIAGKVIDYAVSHAERLFKKKKKKSRNRDL
jgi:ribosomal protein S6--L-glutamate ligase